MMWRILVSQALARRAQKREGEAILVSLEEAGQAPDRSVEMIALDEALQGLARLDERKSQVVELRFFAGLNADETAEVLGISPRTVHREWDLARAWLFRELHR